jgi:hypothetical protein
MALIHCITELNSQQDLARSHLFNTRINQRFNSLTPSGCPDRRDDRLNDTITTDCHAVYALRSRPVEHLFTGIILHFFRKRATNRQPTEKLSAIVALGIPPEFLISVPPFVAAGHFLAQFIGNRNIFLNSFSSRKANIFSGSELPGFVDPDAEVQSPRYAQQLSVFRLVLQ